MREHSGASSPKRLPATRKAELVAYANETGEVTVQELADRFNVSVDTIRRDLDQLDSEGKLIRTHGGALSPSSFPKPDSGLDLRLRVQAEAKNTIGRLASALVSDNSSIMINSGTTSLALVRHLAAHTDLTIATNNLRLPGEIRQEIIRDLYVFGGSARLISQATVGPIVLHTPDGRSEVDIACDIAFIGVGAVSVEQGFSTSNLGEAAMMAAMMKGAARVAIMADSSKFGQRLFAKVADLSGADYLITERYPEPHLAAALAEADVKVIAGGDLGSKAD